MLDKLADSLHPLERKLLPALNETSDLDELIRISGLQHVEAMRAVQWLENKGVVKVDAKEVEVVSLEDNGVAYQKKGLPEKRFLAALEGELTSEELRKRSGLDQNEVSVSIGILRQKGAIEVRKDKDLCFRITPEGKRLASQTIDEEELLKKKFPLEAGSLSADEKQAAQRLLSRKNILKKENKTIRKIELTATGKRLAGMKFKTDVMERLNSKDLKSGAWKGKAFRRFDVEINVPAVYGGKRHFENQVVEYIKSIWLNLGFQEMTGSIVQTSFWDLDALFVPQDHPAREMQDTFYLKSPASGVISEKQILQDVKSTHEDGWTTGSLGWQTAWSEDKAKENLLRTHTTVLSAQTISRLKREQLPAKFFAVGKCFRNETLDWKHLFEFYQVEGIVVDPDANFSNLVGYLKVFFRQMGFEQIRIRPGHFPYTEPSAEVDIWHPARKQWVELGGSGIFRPEVVKPLFGEAVPVLAWGLGLGRMITEYWNITDIRDLYKNDLRQLREFKTWLK